MVTGENMKLFELGAIEISAAAKEALEANNLTSEYLLSKHQQGDWGDLDEVSRQKNDARLNDELSLNSQYILRDGTELNICTAGDRTSTSIFLEVDRTFEEVDTQKGYAIWAVTYDKERNPLIEVEEPIVEKLIDGLPISSVLDVGTGTGRYALKLARRGADVIAIDQSLEMLALAQQKASSEDLKIDFRLASLDDDLPFEANQFDFLVCALMLSHVPNLGLIAQKFYNVLQVDGYLLLTAYHPDIIKYGWRTVFHRPKKAYILPNVSRSRAEYLDTLVSTGFHVLYDIDVPLRNVPAGIIPESVIEEAGDINFCLIILAQK
jgi:2-polyprenyl-3-methyl-5-hydroxy-6-metoxy-1,4-benzoquinol methylase